MTDGDEEWDLGGEGYRVLAKVPPDRVLALTPKEATTITNEVLSSKIRMYEQEADFWHSQMEPNIRKAAEEGEYHTYAFHLHPETAKRMAAYGKSLGWNAEPTYDQKGIRVSWGPERKSELRKMAPLAAVYFLVVILIIILKNVFS